jgi:hypothetical protein
VLGLQAVLVNVITDLSSFTTNLYSASENGLAATTSCMVHVLLRERNENFCRRINYNVNCVTTDTT